MHPCPDCSLNCYCDGREDYVPIRYAVDTCYHVCDLPGDDTFDGNPAEWG